MKLNLPLQSYSARSTKQNAQSLINMYAVQDTAGGKTDLALYPTPGLLLFANASGNLVRGMLENRNTVYLVKDNKFGTLNSSGTFTEKGTLNTTTGRVSLAATFDEVLIATGSTAYHYKISTDTFSTVSDGDFPANCAWVMAQDEYFFALQPSTDTFYLSALSDGTSWSATDFASAEVKADNLVSAISLFTEVWLFGESTTEIWFNTGASFPFERQEGAFINYGCAAAHSVAVANNTCFWLSRSKAGQNVVLRADGQIPKVISTDALHQEFDTYTTVSDAFAYAYQQGGHEFYVLTFPTANKTWVYDITTSLWHERNSINTAAIAQPAYTRHRANAYAFLAGKHLVGDYVSGKIFELHSSTYVDDSTRIIQRQIVTPTMSNDGKLLSVNSLELFFESGVGLSSGQGSDPMIDLEVSRDGGFTWGNVRTRSLGAMGSYRQRAKWDRLGTSRDFTFRFTVTDPVEVIVIGATIDIEAEGGYDRVVSGNQG